MKVHVSLAVFVFLAAAAPAFAQTGSNPVDPVAKAKAVIETADTAYVFAKKVVVDLHDVAGSQESIVTKHLEPAQFKVPEKGCDLFAGFDSGRADPITFKFAGDTQRTMEFQLVWSGAVCPAPPDGKPGDPAEWHYLKTAKLIPIDIQSLLGMDLAMDAMVTDVGPQPLWGKGDLLKKGERPSPEAVYMQATIQLNVRRSNLLINDMKTLLITVDGLGSCKFHGNTTALTMLSGGHCAVVKSGGKKNSTVKAKTITDAYQN